MTAAAPPGWATISQIPRTLAADLLDLAVDLRPGGCLQTALALFDVNLRRLIPSALGATIGLSCTGSSMPVVINLVARTIDRDEIGAVRRRSLAEIAPAVTGWIDFYAGDPQAFDLLGGETASRELPDGPVTPGVYGLQHFSTLNHAVGILLARGYDVDAGRAELSHRAEVAHADLLVAAKAVIASISH